MPSISPSGSKPDNAPAQPRHTLPPPPPSRTRAELEAGLELIRQSPANHGRLELIVCRPQNETRQVVQQAELDPAEGLRGDNWKSRGSSMTVDGSAHRDMQLTLMNARVITLLAGNKTHWPLAGDQLFVDLDLSTANAPAGTRWTVGSAVIEITALPHTGCRKFQARFGAEALRLVNSPTGKELRMRGVNARVVQPGVIHVGDRIERLPRASS